MYMHVETSPKRIHGPVNVKLPNLNIYLLNTLQRSHGDNFAFDETGKHDELPLKGLQLQEPSKI